MNLNRVSKPRLPWLVFAGVCLVVLSSVNWQFLHGVRDRVLVVATQREFAEHWSVMNTGKPVASFPYSHQAKQFSDLSVHAVKWYRELKARSHGKPLDQHPNVLWTVEIADPHREDSLLEPRMTLTVRIYATDCYEKVVTQENCVGYPSLMNEERVALHYVKVGNQWHVSDYRLLAEYLFPKDDRLFWLCLHDGDDSDCPLAPNQ